MARAPRGQAAGEAGRAVAVSPVRHVLLDADGVIQRVPGGWFAAIEPYLGERSREFLHRTWRDELPQYRAAYMRDVLGYDALFDVSCYWCDLGVAKPAPAFFAEAARRVGADPSAILFIDDTARNVDGARTAGLTAAQWSFEQGHHALAEVLASHGVITDPAGDSTRQ